MARHRGTTPKKHKPRQVAALVRTILASRFQWCQSKGRSNCPFVFIQGANKNGCALQHAWVTMLLLHNAVLDPAAVSNFIGSPGHVQL